MGHRPLGSSHPREGTADDPPHHPCALPFALRGGDQDGFFDATSQEAVRAAYPKADYQAYPGYGHNMFWEIPDQVAASILPFLDAP